MFPIGENALIYVLWSRGDMVHLELEAELGTINHMVLILEAMERVENITNSGTIGHLPRKERKSYMYCKKQVWRDWATQTFWNPDEFFTSSRD